MSSRRREARGIQAKAPDLGRGGTGSLEWWLDPKAKHGCFVGMVVAFPTAELLCRAPFWLCLRFTLHVGKDIPGALPRTVQMDVFRVPQRQRYAIFRTRPAFLCPKLKHRNLEQDILLVVVFPSLLLIL